MYYLNAERNVFEDIHENGGESEDIPRTHNHLSGEKIGSREEYGELLLRLLLYCAYIFFICERRSTAIQEFTNGISIL